MELKPKTRRREAQVSCTPYEDWPVHRHLSTVSSGLMVSRCNIHRKKLSRLSLFPFHSKASNGSFFSRLRLATVTMLASTFPSLLSPCLEICRWLRRNVYHVMIYAGEERMTRSEWPPVSLSFSPMGNLFHGEFLRLHRASADSCLFCDVGLVGRAGEMHF